MITFFSLFLSKHMFMLFISNCWWGINSNLAIIFLQHFDDVATLFSGSHCFYWKIVIIIVPFLSVFTVFKNSSLVFSAYTLYP